MGLEHTCDGHDTPPLMQWGGLPVGAQSLVFIMEDLDAGRGPKTHWLIWDIPKGIDTREPVHLDHVGVQGRNDFQTLGYRGPCPARDGTEHRYRFTLYALDVESLDLSPGRYRSDAERAMEGHVLGNAAFIARYSRGPVVRRNAPLPDELRRRH